MFYLFLLAHLIADFVLQPLWLVLRKKRWDGLCMHGGVVLGWMLLIPLVEPRALGLWPAMLAITAIHIGADRWKVKYADKIIRPPVVPFLLDQVIHVTTLAVVLSFALPVEQVWSLQSTPAALPALYASIYIIAAFATPIGVMVWLDPIFSHAILAAKARTRSFVAGTAITSLALFGGSLALPATLIGLAVATQRPRSLHPLDRPLGLMVVACVAALLGAVMTVVL